MLSAWLVASPALATIVTLEPAADNTVFSERRCSVDDQTVCTVDGDCNGGETCVHLSNGAGNYVFSGTINDGYLRRALLIFDIAGSVPAGATINIVTLSLRQSRTKAKTETLSLHRALESWGEAGSTATTADEGRGGPALAGDATWLHTFFPGSFWLASGGDYVAGASASESVAQQINQFYTWGSTAQMVADVQGWLDTPATNFGWILIGNEIDTQTVKRFDGGDIADPSRRPLLEIDYTLPPDIGDCCNDDGLCTSQTPTACTGLHLGVNTACTANPCTTDVGACCSTEDASCSLVLDPGGGCSGLYQGPGSVCSPNTCPPPVTGACCIADAAATCNDVTAATCASGGGTYQGDGSTCAATACPVIPTPYVDALPLPAIASPVSGSSGSVAEYDMYMQEVQQQLHSELPPTTVWAYGDGPASAGYPGPTIEAGTGSPVTVNWINDLRDTSSGSSLRTDHYLSVDTCPHGAVDQPKTVVHLHGGHVPAAVDGHPEATFLPGAQVQYVYPNNQLPATMWYHDHALGITRLNVYMGLAGFYLIRDAFEAGLGLPPAPEFEIPLAIQDRSFNPDGTWRYPAAWQDTFFGDVMLVNGKVWPVHSVKQGKYRLRLLNGCNSRTLRLQFCPGSNASPCPTPATFELIGVEGGLLGQKIPMTEITLGNAERADVVVDFGPYGEDDEVYLVNSAPAPFPGIPGEGVVADVMKFVVNAEVGYTTAVPLDLRTMEVLDENDATVFRDFELDKGPGDTCSPFTWEVISTDGLNGPVLGSHWVDQTEFPELGSTEVWRFSNMSGMTHPMHMHLVLFQLLDRQAFDIVSGDIVPTGPVIPPAPEESGWKDTVRVDPNEMVRVIARFDDYKGLFAYHCHILEHEDHEMMREFRVVECGDGVTEGAEQCDDGNTWSLDGCSATCEIEPCSGDVDSDTICDDYDPCNSYMNTQPLNLGSCVAPADPNADCNSDGIPNECQCGDTNANGVLQAGDAFAVAGCVTDPGACTLDIGIADTNNNGLFQAGDAFAIASVVTMNTEAYTLTCARRPEGTAP